MLTKKQMADLFHQEEDNPIIRAFLRLSKEIFAYEVPDNVVNIENSRRTRKQDLTVYNDLDFVLKNLTYFSNHLDQVDHIEILIKYKETISEENIVKIMRDLSELRMIGNDWDRDLVYLLFPENSFLDDSKILSLISFGHIEDKQKITRIIDYAICVIYSLIKLEKRFIKELTIEYQISNR